MLLRGRAIGPRSPSPYGMRLARSWGGFWGRTGYGFVFVELLALGPARGGGLGREVMALAEGEARRRGLVGMWLDTWTFQAPGFYQKLGFTECGRIVEYPRGHDRIFYVKRFT